MTDVELAVGRTVRLPINLTSATIHVDVVLIDQRKAYGRTDWLVAPVSGSDDAAWVREASILGETQGARPTGV